MLLTIEKKRYSVNLYFFFEKNAKEYFASIERENGKWVLSVYVVDEGNMDLLYAFEVKALYKALYHLAKYQED